MGGERKKPKPEYRYDQHGVRRLIVRAEGYVMARRPGAAPHVMSEKAWAALSDKPVEPETS